MWECKRCGKCCKFIVIPIMDPIDLDTEAYLKAHGIVYKDKKLYIPARCRFLIKVRGKTIYRCKIHQLKYANCRLSGEKECKMAKAAWELLNPDTDGGSAED